MPWLVIALSHIGLDAFDVLAPLLAQETGKEVASVAADILVFDYKVMAVITAHLHELSRQPPEGGNVIFLLSSTAVNNAAEGLKLRVIGLHMPNRKLA